MKPLWAWKVFICSTSLKYFEYERNDKPWILLNSSRWKWWKYEFLAQQVTWRCATCLKNIFCICCYTVQPYDLGVAKICGELSGQTSIYFFFEGKPINPSLSTLNQLLKFRQGPIFPNNTWTLLFFWWDHKDINRLGVLHVEWLRRLVGCHGHCYFSSNKLEILLNAGLDVDTPGLLHSSVAGSCHWAGGWWDLDFSSIDSVLPRSERFLRHS